MDLVSLFYYGMHVRHFLIIIYTNRVFGKRYREVVRGWEASVRGGGTNDRRINWSGSALNTFYAAIRKALVVVIVARALAVIFGVSFALWWIFS